ncbi:isoaspartyl peptidase/L-asparaginase family protein [Lutibacter sp. B1]|uniref:isoaspartyl peptidase/L-asparaginase family protein n=1 Tax=Lutibacter sp. B1 TaxID=2725996 RepID=UPI0014569CF7|nr:isoaspartyl peptidase/L-asparaginase [Lutibacter sp. B1]NLP56668.1 isoaspartyl peptidase/L-asparaginase [Lutibacter sp. B1]
MKKTILLLFILLLAFSCKTSDKNEPQREPNSFSIVIHGGAGGIKREYFTDEQQQAYNDKLQEALNAGYEVLEKGGISLDAIQAAINVMEDSPLFNAGKGAVYNSKGNQEMDASIMDGKTLNSGAVAGVNHIKNPILAARVVMDSSEHVMLSGKGAEIMVKKFGIEMVDSSYFFTQKRLDQLKKIQGKEKTELDHSAFLIKNELIDDHKYGTVGAVAIDKEGNIAAGTSTGGMTNKKYGRIGDSPIIGAGTYANNLTCGISCTGTGEYFIRTVAAHEVSNLIQYKKMNPTEALYEVIFNQIGKLGGEGGMILLDKYGDIYWDFNSTGMFRGYKKSDGETKIEMFEKE